MGEGKGERKRERRELYGFICVVVMILHVLYCPF